MNRTFQVVWKIVKRAIVSLLILIVLCGAILAVPQVQTSLASKALGFLKTEFDLDISVKSVDLQFPNIVHIHDAYAPDHKNDTLFYAQDLHVKFSGFHDNHLVFDDVKLKGGKFLMRKYEEDSLFNFMYWLEHFNTPTEDTVVEPFYMSIHKVYISDFTYMKNRINCDTCTQLFYEDATVMVSDFQLEDAYVEAEVDQLQFTDHHRFNLYDFQAKAFFLSNRMGLEDLYFKTDASEVTGTATLKYKDLDDLEDFLDAVQMEGQFENSKISSTEFQSYIPEFPSFDTVKVHGSFKGTVNDLSAVNMDISLGNTQFFGDVHIVDCTEPDDLYLDAFVGYCQTNGEDIDRYVSPFVEGGLPEQLLQMSFMKLSGHFEGTLDEFTTRAEIASNLGDLNINMGFKDLNQPEIASYQGELGLKNFDIGGLLSEESLGKVTAAGSVQGLSFERDKANIELDLTITEGEYNRYTYRNISVEGDVADHKFNGGVKINDPRVKFNFDGILDFTQDTATLDFVANIDSTDLYTIGFLPNGVSWLAGDVVADFRVYKDEWWQGQIKIDDVTFRKGAKVHAFNQFVLTSSNEGQTTSNAIKSDILEGKIEGRYKLLEVHKPILKALASVNSNFPYSETVEDANFKFNLELKKPDIVTDLLMPGLRIASHTTLHGKVNTVKNQLNIEVESPGLDIFGTYLDTSSISISGVGGDYRLNSSIKSVFTGESFKTQEVLFNSRFLMDSTRLSFSGTLMDSIDSRIELNGYMLQPSVNSAMFSFDQFEFNVAQDTLILDKVNRLTIEPNRLIIDNYNFRGRSSSLSMNGIVSEAEYEILRLNINELNLELVNYLLREESTKFEGNATGMLILNNLFGQPSIAGGVSVDSLRYNDQFLGRLDFNMDWDVVKNKTTLQGGLTLGTLHTLQVDGFIARDSVLPLSINIGLNRFRLACFNPYMYGIIDNLRGLAQGNIHIGGSLDKPTLDGKLSMPNAAFSVPFIGTDYNFEGSPTIHLSSDKIILDRIPIRDTKDQTTGVASGFVYHNNLSDLKFDLNVDADGLLSMDTQEGENNYFYGKAYTSGLVRIVGPTDQMKLQIDVEAEKGTSIKLPLSSPTEIGQNEFITFVDPTKEEATTAFGFMKKGQIKELGGLSISVNANMKPEAEVKLIMDESVGGEIQGKGMGLVKIDLSSSGDLSIFGNYTVAEGEYKFDLRNVVSKNFKIKSGSTLNWSGDPMDAQIDLLAEYSTRTTLNGVVSNSSGYNGQRVRVNLIMHLTGPLMNPKIAFSIEVPNVSTAWQEEIRNRLSNQDKMMDNAFSLLVANSFWNPENTLSDAIASQPLDQMAGLMSNWAAKSVLGEYADLSVNYNSNNVNQQLYSEWEIGVSKSFANDRLIVNSNIDIPVSATNTSSSTTQQTVTGDVEVEYKITQDGRIRAKAFNRSNQNNPGFYNLSPYTQGVSVYYQADFNTWNELVEKIFGHPIQEPVDSTYVDTTQISVPGIPNDSTEVRP